MDFLLNAGILTGHIASMIFFAWLAGKLLGVNRLPLKTLIIAGGMGFAFGQVVAISFGLHGAYLIELLITMMTIVLLELLGATGRKSLFFNFQELGGPGKKLGMRYRLFRRSSEITHIAVRHGIASLLGLSKSKDREMNWQIVAGRSREAMEEAGGTFVKLGQLLSTRMDLIPPSAAKEFTKLQEQAVSVEPDSIRMTFEKETGRQIDEVFSSFDYSPLATASIAQVHEAVLLSGEPVVVKIRKPGVAEKIRLDTSIMIRLAKAAEKTEWGSALGVADFALDFTKGILEELDFHNEARNAAEFASAVSDLEGVRLPRIHEELTASGILVMEHFKGLSVGKAGKDHLENTDGESLARLLLRAQMKPMFNGQRFHADLHPGNVILLDEGIIGLIDLGATGKLDTFEQTSIRDMMIAMKQNDPVMLREATMGVATLRKKLDPLLFERALAQFMSKNLGPGSKPNAAMLNELMQIFMAFGVALPSSTTTLFRALVTLEGTLDTLSPGFPIIDAAQDIASEIARDSLNPQSLYEKTKEQISYLIPTLMRIPRHMDQLAGLLQKGDLSISIRLFSNDRDVHIVTKLVNKFVLSILGGILCLISVLLLSNQSGPVLRHDLQLFEVIGYAGLFLGAILILRVALAVFREES